VFESIEGVQSAAHRALANGSNDANVAKSARKTPKLVVCNFS